MSLGVIVVSPGWVAGEHIRAFHHNPHTHLAAMVVSRESERRRAEQYQKRFGFECRVTEDYDDALAMEETGIVTVCSINCFHYRHTLAALEAGKHVLVEKPMALKPEEVTHLCNAARRAEVATMVGHVVRYYPAIKALHKLVAGGQLGEVFHVECDYWHEIAPGWKSEAETAGGALAQGGIHAVDLLRHMMGENKKVTRVSAAWSGPFRRKDFTYKPNVSALVGFEDGSIGRVGTSLEVEMPYVFHLQVNGTRGTLRENSVYAPELFPAEKRFVEMQAQYPDDWDVAGHPFAEEVDDFVESVRSGTPNSLDFRHASATYELVFAIERAAGENSTVTLGRNKGDFCLPY